MVDAVERVSGRSASSDYSRSGTGRPQVDVTGGAAGRTAGPQEPVAGRDGGADRGREQHRHPLGLALVPGGHQLLGILEDLAIGRPARSRFLLGRLSASVIHFALVEAHE
jgi:hypothetical protein